MLFGLNFFGDDAQTAREELNAIGQNFLRGRTSDTLSLDPSGAVAEFVGPLWSNPLTLLVKLGVRNWKGIGVDA